MRSTRIVTISTAALVAIGAAASERKVQMKDLPAAVQKTVQEQTRSAKLVGLAEEVEEGKTFYEAETKVDGRTRDILIDAAGTVVEVEEEVPLGSIPEGARSAIQRAAANGKLQRVESVTKGGTTVYEATITRDGKKAQVVVTSDGTIKKQ